jgi:hypothetical protein
LSVHEAFDPLAEAFLHDPYARQLAAHAGLRPRHPLLHRLGPPDQEVPFHPDISFRGPQVLWVQA